MPRRHAAKVSCPLTAAQVLDLYFLEHRAKLLDIAAFLDRMDRTSDAADADFRRRAFERAVKLLIDGCPERARRILDMLSDPTTQPIKSAAGMKGALGAYAGKGPRAKGLVQGRGVVA